MTQRPLALVLGATGGSGGETAARLAARGWRVRAMRRGPPPAGHGHLDWVQGDALSEADVARAAEGAQLIVHAVNPPGYRNWAGTVVPMLDNTIAAARRQGARIAFPGSVYNFHPAVFPRLSEDTPQHPVTRKGALRVEMERRLAEAAEAGTPVLILRAGDFFGPRAANNWFSQVLVKSGRPVSSVTLPGPADVPHAWAYLPDFAETLTRLIARGPQASFEVFHMRGHQVTGRQMAEAVSRAAGRRVPVRAMPWLGVHAAAPFVEMMRELVEMRYLCRLEHELDNSRLRAALGEEPHTPLDVAVRTTLTGLGCLARPPLEQAA